MMHHLNANPRSGINIKYGYNQSIYNANCFHLWVSCNSLFIIDQCSVASVEMVELSTLRACYWQLA